VIALPPLFGTVKDTTMSALPGWTLGCAGADGIVLGIAAADAGDAGLVPFAFVAVTVHVYDFPLVRPPTLTGDAAPLAAPAVPPFPDGHATSYSVIALPPLFGAVNDTTMSALPGTTVGCAGVDGTVLGIATADSAEGAPSPFAFVAVTVHVYDFPFDRPATTIGELAPPSEPAAPPFEDAQSAVYPVIGLPPSNGVVNETVICALPGVTDGCAGGSGTRLGITGADAGDGELGPCTFAAVTVHVYVLPLVRPVTMIGEPAPPTVSGGPPFEDVQVAL
jgi:hypothetical protein